MIKVKKSYIQLKVPGWISVICFTLACCTIGILANQANASADGIVARYASAELLKSLVGLHEGAVIETAGFYRPGDGGAALYRIQKLTRGFQPNGADVLALQNGLGAVLVEREAVNYRMFGAIGDGENDDGVQIKLAHAYANRHRIPVVNPSGEFWIKHANNIAIKTPVDWGSTIFFIDERFNHKEFPRFVVLNDEPTRTLELDEPTKAALLEKIRPGVQIIDELAPYAGHLILVEDATDRIGIRAGNYSRRGWAREELFFREFGFGSLPPSGTELKPVFVEMLKLRHGMD